MWWNKKKKNEKANSSDRLHDRFSASVNNYVLGKQLQMANFLNRKTRRLSTRDKMLFLAVVCLVLGGISLYLIINTVFGTPLPPSMAKPNSISLPEHINKTGHEHLYPAIRVTDRDIKEIRRFKYYMDSLQRSSNAKTLYDSILTVRPHLMDTVAMLEDLYLFQKK